MGGRFITELLEFNIYNRWGELVYHTTDPTQGWDGTYNGQVPKTLTYTYTRSAPWLMMEKRSLRKGI